MQQQEECQNLPQLRYLNITPGLQLKLSQVLSNSPSSFRIQSDYTILKIREQNTVDIYFCDTEMTKLQNFLAIEGVNSLREISVRYNVRQEQVIMVYRCQKDLVFYRGRLPNQERSRAGSSIIGPDSLVIEIDKNWKILDISEIYYVQNIGAHCLITISTGQVYLFQYNQHKRKISFMGIETGIWNKVGGVIKSIRKQFQQRYQYKSCTSILYHPFNNEQLFAIILLQQKLIIKKYNLAIQQAFRIDNSCREQMSFQINIEQKMQGNSQIINSLLIPNNTPNHEHQITILLISSNGITIDLNEIIINLNTKQNQFSTILDLFHYKKNNQINQHEQDQIQKYNINTDFVDLQYFNNKIFTIYHKDIGYKKKHFITIMDRKIINNFANTNSNTLRFTQQLKMVKIQQPINYGKGNYNHIEDQKYLRYPKLVLIGGTFCLQLVDGDDGGREYFGQEYKGNRSIISYQDNRKQPLQTVYEENRQLDYQNSSKRAERCITNKDFIHLFHLFNVEKEQFNNLRYLPSDQQIFKHLLSTIMLKLFTYEQQYIEKPNNELIKQIFNQTFPKNYYKQLDDYNKFIKNLFVNNQIRCLLTVLEVLIQKKHYTGIYQICVDIIPSFILNMQKNYKQQLGEDIQINLNGRSGILIEMRYHIATNYLHIYQQLLKILSQQNYMEIESIEPNQSVIQKKLVMNGSKKGRMLYRNFEEIEQEELFDKYLMVRNMCEWRENIEQMREIFQIYYNKGQRFRELLTAMSIKYKNITLFDFMLLRRMISRDEILRFYSEYESQQNHEQIKMLFINLINVTIKRMVQNKGNNAKIYDKNLAVLFWIPSALVLEIYGYLIDNYTVIGIIFGIMHRMRKNVVLDLSRKVQIFEQFSSCNQVLEILQPLYQIITDKYIKINVDLARLYCKSNYHQFISMNCLIKNNQNHFNNLNVSNKCWEQFVENVKKYGNTELMQKITEVKKKLNVK